MPDGASPRSGDVYLKFNGNGDYAEIPNLPDYSVSTTSELTVAVWMRPDSLNFQHYEGSHYVHWIGKGEAGQQEWLFRMYNRDHTTEHPPRPNRISFYVFNPDGRLGVGSYFQDVVVQHEWMHVAAVVEANRLRIYRDGQFRRCDTYAGDATGGCPIHFQPPPNEDQQLVITPQAGNAPLRLGTRDLHSFFRGGLARFRVWNRVLTADEIAGLYGSDSAPQDGLVGEFLMNDDTGATLADTAQGNNGTITGAAWSVQG